MRAFVVSITFLAFALGCSSKSSSNKGAAGAQGKGHNCGNPTINVCAGDQVVHRDHKDEVKKLTITEVVKAGELSRFEVNYLKAMGAAAKYVEPMIREQSRKAGMRLFYGEVNEKESSNYIKEQDFRSLYQGYGCVNNASPCVGQKLTVLSSFSTIVTQEILGISFDPKNPSPILIKQGYLTSKSTEITTVGDVFKDVISDQGCTNLEGTKNLFCVGEKYWQTMRRYEGSHGFETVLFVGTSKVDPLIVTDKGVWRKTIKGMGVYTPQVRQGCVIYKNDECVLQLGESMVDLMMNQYDKEVVERTFDVKIAGVLLPDVYSEEFHRVLVGRESPESYYGYKDEVVEGYFRNSGCSKDGRVCVGKSYKYNYKSQDGTIHILAINAAKNLAMGQTSYYSVKVVAPIDSIQ